MIDLDAHWWGEWVAPAITLSLTIGAGMVGSAVIRWSARRGSLVVGVGRLADADAVAETFQRTLLVLTVLMVLSFTSRADRLTDALFTGYCGATLWLLIASIRNGLARGMGWVRNKFLLAFAFGLVLSLFFGVIVHTGVDVCVHYLLRPQ